MVHYLLQATSLTKNIPPFEEEKYLPKRKYYQKFIVNK